MNAYQVMNSPLVVTAISSGLALLMALVGVIFRLGMLISEMKSVHREMADDIRAIREDKDIMRWSDYRTIDRMRQPGND